MTTALAILFIAVAVLIILVVLVQRGRGGGLAGAFGSGGGSSSAFGTKTGDVFTTATVVLFVVFMLLAIWLNFRFQAYKETSPFMQATTIPEVTTAPAAAGSFTPPSLPAIPETPATMPASPSGILPSTPITGTPSVPGPAASQPK